jgi:CDP-paratose 2-epimerase
MRFLITGICGFVGSQIAFYLREHFDGAHISGIDNFRRPGSETNRPKLEALGIKVQHADVRMDSDWDQLPGEADWVIDAAAEPSVLAGLTKSSSPKQLIEMNLGGTVCALEYCRRHNAGLVLLSTSRVYSIPTLCELPVVPHNDCFVLKPGATLPPGVNEHGIGAACSTAAPISLYGATKLASELLASEYAAAFGIPVWINRCGVLSGAGQFGTADQGIFAFWINAHLRRRPLRYIGFEGSGHQSRDVLHAKDLASLIAKQVAQKPGKGQAPISIAGGGTERLMSLRQLTAWCDKRFGNHPVAQDLTPRPYDIPWVVMDSNATIRTFDWTPQWSLEAILDEIATHAGQHPHWLELSGAK